MIEQRMKWSWRVARLAGIGVYVHFTFLLLVLWAAMHGFAAERTWTGALSYVGFILVLFLIVVLHELGHALMARRYGIGTRDITLLPIGGIARLERMPEDPKQELAVALAGPAVNVVLAIAIGIGLALAAQVTSWQHVLDGGNGFFFRLFAVNVFLVLFNLLPAFPMDGGRVLRALLAMRTNYLRATRIAASVGQAMALLLGLGGLFGFFGTPFNPFLIVIAVFVWFGAAQESNIVKMRSALGTSRVDQLMITDFKTLAPEETLGRAAELLLSGHQQDFPVCQNGAVIGMLTRTSLLNGLNKLGSNLPVADAMEHQFLTADANEPAEAAFQRLQTQPFRSLPILNRGELVGLVTDENIAEYLMIHEALRTDSASPGLRRLEHRHA